jgi:predicted transcriptional regulator
MQSLSVPLYILMNKDLTNTSKILLSVIENDTFFIEYCTKTIKEFSEIAGISPLAVSTSLHKMQSDGLLTIHKGLSEKNRPQYKYTMYKTQEQNYSAL